MHKIGRHKSMMNISTQKVSTYNDTTHAFFVVRRVSFLLVAQRPRGPKRAREKSALWNVQ